MRVHRLQNPFEHWRTGLLAELALFALYLMILIGSTVLLVTVI